jgi:hypothetical protein
VKTSNFGITILFILLLLVGMSITYLADRIDKMDARVTNIEMAKER